MKSGDKILALFLLVVIALSFAGVELYKNSMAGKSRVAVISQNGSALQTIRLDAVDRPYEMVIGGGYRNRILVERGRIRFSEANCPDLVCVRTGWISRPGETAVCLPNRVSIRIEGERKGVDDIAF